MASYGLSKPWRRKVLHEQFRNPSVNRRTSTNLGRSYRYFRSYFSIYIYMCCTYTYILHTAHSLQQKGTRKRTRKSDENEVHFPRRPLRYGPKETTKIWASRGHRYLGRSQRLLHGFTTSGNRCPPTIISSFLFLRWLRRDVAIPLEPETWAERESMQFSPG